MAFVVSLNGSALASGQWTIVQGAVGTSSGISGMLEATTCAGTSCWAVGASPAQLASTPAIIESNSGTGWSMAEAPTPTAPNQNDDLAAITCVDAADCWAVGHSNDQALAEEYSNGAWAYVPSANPAGTSAWLTGVSCTGLSDCWAVGWSAAADNSYHTLIEHYTGTDWTIFNSPDGGSPNSNILTGVTCPESNDCWAAGGAQDNTPLIEHYDGTAWAVVSGLAITGPASSFNSITCTSVTDCWAVGVHNTTTDNETQTLIEHFDGSTWEAVSSPNPWGGPSGENYLYGVSCASSDACVAVGYSFGFVAAGFGQTLIEQYSPATGWTVTGPTPPVEGEQFMGASCGASVCVAVGENSEDGEPVIAEGSVAQPSEGSTGGASQQPSPRPTDLGAGLTVPDTGAGATPWVPLLIVAGVGAVALGARRRQRRH
jgi:hypothetical protein